jgi:hypothetical protein
LGLLNNLANYLYTRQSNGTHSYTINRGATAFGSGTDKLELARTNPVLFAVIEIRAKLLSLAEFYVERNGEKDYDDPIIQLINNPNHLQSKQDFLKQYEWYKMAYGYVYQRPVIAKGFEVPSAIFNLKSSRLTFPESPKSHLIATKKEIEAYNEQIIKYNKKGQDNKTYTLAELIPFYDITNDMSDMDESQFTSPSRIDAVLKQIGNINIAGDAENVMLQTNGREIFSGGSKGSALGSSIPMDERDRIDVESKLINGYGFGFGKKRSIATKMGVDWQSLHIPLRDLGLHESIQSNANIATQVFEVPNELYKAFMDGDTFENKEKAMLGMIQNVVQPEANDLANSYTSMFGYSETPIRATFEHLPIMQITEDKKADKIVKISTAYRNLVQSGVSPQDIDALFESLGIKPIKE